MLGFRRVSLILFSLLLATASAIAAADTHMSGGNSSDETERQIQAAAGAFLKKMHPLLRQDKVSYGFLADDKLATMKLGKSFPLYGLSDEQIKAYEKGQPVAKYVDHTGHWFVPVEAPGGTRVLIEVERDQTGRWVGTGLGWAPLARKWRTISTAWSESGTPAPMLVMCYSVPGYFFAVPYGAEPNLTSLATLKAEDEPKAVKKPALNDAWTTVSTLRAALSEAHAEEGGS